MSHTFNTIGQTNIYGSLRWYNFYHEVVYTDASGAAQTTYVDYAGRWIEEASDDLALIEPEMTQRRLDIMAGKVDLGFSHFRIYTVTGRADYQDFDTLTTSDTVHSKY